MMLWSPLHRCKSRGSVSVGLTPGCSKQPAYSLRLVCVMSHQRLQPPWTFLPSAPCSGPATSGQTLPILATGSPGPCQLLSVGRALSLSGFGQPGSQLCCCCPSHHPDGHPLWLPALSLSEGRPCSDCPSVKVQGLHGHWPVPWPTPSQNSCLGRRACASCSPFWLGWGERAARQNLPQTAALAQCPRQQSWAGSQEAMGLRGRGPSGLEGAMVALIRAGPDQRPAPGTIKQAGHRANCQAIRTQETEGSAGCVDGARGTGQGCCSPRCPGFWQASG